MKKEYLQPSLIFHILETDVLSTSDDNYGTIPNDWENVLGNN